MRTDVPVHLVSDVEAFPACPFIEDSHKQVGSCKISHDGSWAWIVRNSVLEIFSTQKVERKSYWSFRTEQKGSGVSISSVTEFYSIAASPQLVVTLDVANLLCLFDINSSTIIRAVHLPFRIESVEVVATRGGACIQTRPLAPELRYMFGIVAVAVEDGHIFLVDLCLDEDSGYTDETQPGEPFFASTTTLNLAQKRELAVNSYQHMTLNLNESDFHRGTFLYRGPEGEVITAFNTAIMSITSLKYIPHLTMLVVGFSFGGFQLWNLQKLLLDYSSAVDSEADPVVKFAFQEPENDPRNYCYLWVVRGQAINDLINPNITSVATLYSLGYQKKEWIENYGFIYQGMQNCVHRLSYPLTTQPLEINFTASYGSRVISFHCIQQGEIINLPRADLEELHSDDFANQDLSLCVVVWEAWNDMSNPAYFLALFDINQWYQAQMPSSIRCRKNDQCSYFGVFSLLEVKEKIQNGNLLDVHICQSSFVKHKALNGSDEMYFPSSLAFKALCASECGILNVSYLGTQRQVLWEMEELGPSCLINPTNLYNLCVTSSLLPVSSEVSGNVILKREALLTLALNYNLFKFITSCIWQWSSVDYSKNGLTLKFLLNWIWKRVTLIKNSTDKICAPLFNHSGQELEQNSLMMLHNYATQLERLSSILKVMRSQTGPITETGLQELQTRQEVTQLIATFLRVILWLYYCSLLPEHAEGEAYGENEVAYPASTLLNTYSHRRRDMQLLHASVGQTDLLLIDGMLSHFGELPLQWEKGNSRFYPPPSLYALLGIYLVKGPPLEDKHCLMLYLLLDMAAFLSDKQSHLEEKLMKFPAAFKMSHSRVKLTQGFWMLDHRDFEEAILFFTDPVIIPGDILPWQHLRVLKSFLYQGEHQKALKYIQICKPSLQTPEEVKIYLTVLLANKLIVEAFQYQRQCCDERNNEDLLTHFFLGCQQTGNLDALLQLPFSSSEEEALVHFLFNSREYYHKDLLVTYFLQRSQPLEAAHVNERIKPPLMDADSQTKERVAIRSSLVSGFLHTLPEMQSRLATEVGKHHIKMTSVYSSASCPVPLSTKIHHNSVNVLTQSSRLYDLMTRVKDTWSINQIIEQSPLRSSKQESTVWRSEGIPFIETPGTQRKLKKLDSEVIFATPLSKRKLSMDYSDSAKSNNKKFKGIDPFTSQSRGDFEKRFNFSRIHRPISSEVLSLLQTPPVKKIVPPIRARTLERVQALNTDTPPSILKVRQLIRRSATPPNLQNVSRSLFYPVPVEKEMSEEVETSDENDDGESGKNLRFDIPETSKGSVTPSDWESTPERASPQMVQPESSIRSSLRSRLNFSQNSANSSFGGLSVHNSDNILDVDEDITINFSVQNRREISFAIGKEVSFLKPALPKPAFIEKVEEIADSPWATPKSVVKNAPSPSTEVAVLYNIEASPPRETSPLIPTPRPHISHSPIVEPSKAKFSPISTLVEEEPLEIYHQILSNEETDTRDGELRLSESDSEIEFVKKDLIATGEIPPSPSTSPSHSPQIIDSDDEGIADNYASEMAKIEPEAIPYQLLEHEEAAISEHVEAISEHQEDNNGRDDAILKLRQVVSEPEEVVLDQREAILESQETISEQGKVILEQSETVEQKEVSSARIHFKNESMQIEDSSAQEKAILKRRQVVSEKGDSIFEPEEVVLEQREIIFEPEEVVLEQREIIFEPEEVILEQREAIFETEGAVSEQSGVVLEQSEAQVHLENESMEIKDQLGVTQPLTQYKCDSISTNHSVNEPSKEIKVDEHKLSFERRSFRKEKEGIMAETSELTKPITRSIEKLNLTLNEKSVVMKDEDIQMEKFIEGAKSLLSDAFNNAKGIGSDSTKSKRMVKVRSLPSLDNSANSDLSQEKPKLTRQTRSLRSSRKELKSEDDSDASMASISYSQRGTEPDTKTQKSRKESEDSDSSLVLRSKKVVTKGIKRGGSKKKDADESITPASPTTSDVSSSVFLSPEKWVPRLRPRSRVDSISSLDSSPPNITKELGAIPKTTKLTNFKTTKDAMEADPILETSIQRRGGRKPKKSEILTSHSITAIPEDSILESDTILAQGIALPFVFSPPSTRSRTRRKKSDSFSEQSSMYEAQSFQNTSQIDEVSSSRKNTGPIPPWECFINVISPPPTEIKDDSKKKTRTSSASTLSSRLSMQLRKGPFKTRKKVKL